MKTVSSNVSLSLAARILNLVGVILILSFLLDFVTVLFPFQPLDQLWQLNFTTHLVEPGVIPMVGLALIFAGYWIGNSASDSPANPKPWLDLRFWAILFSILFGLLFLVLFPLHVSNIDRASNQAIAQIDQKASNDETSLETQLNSPQAQFQLQQQQTQVKAQIDDLLKNEQKYNQVLQDNKIPQQLKDLLKESKAHPDQIDQLVQQQLRVSIEALRTKTLNQIQSRQTEDKQRAKQEAWKSGVRIGSTSLLLAIGYIAIGWMGLRSMDFFRPGHRQYSAR